MKVSNIRRKEEVTRSWKSEAGVVVVAVSEIIIKSRIQSRLEDILRSRTQRFCRDSMSVLEFALEGWSTGGIRWGIWGTENVCVFLIGQRQPRFGIKTMSEQIDPFLNRMLKWGSSHSNSTFPLLYYWNTYPSSCSSLSSNLDLGMTSSLPISQSFIQKSAGKFFI